MYIYIYTYIFCVCYINSPKVLENLTSVFWVNAGQYNARQLELVANKITRLQIWCPGVQPTPTSSPKPGPCVRASSRTIATSIYHLDPSGYLT